MTTEGQKAKACANFLRHNPAAKELLRLLDVGAQGAEDLEHDGLQAVRNAFGEAWEAGFHSGERDAWKEIPEDCNR